MLIKKQDPKERKIARFLKKLRQGLNKRFHGLEFVIHDDQFGIIISWFNGVTIEKVTRLLDGIENSKDLGVGIGLDRRYTEEMLLHCIAEWKKENVQHQDENIEEYIYIKPFGGTGITKDRNNSDSEDRKRFLTMVEEIFTYAKQVDGSQFPQCSWPEYTSAESAGIIAKQFEKDGIEVKGIATNEAGMAVVKI